MAATRPSSTDDLTLDEVIARLAGHDAVAGLLTIGSTGRATLNPASDYDLVVILRRRPVPLTVGLTYVAGRLTDVVFVDLDEVRRIVEPAGAGAEAGPAIWGEQAVAAWLRGGQVVYDPTGLLGRGHDIVAARPEAAAGDAEVYSAWFSINYNLVQNRRMLASDDTAYLTGLDVRLLYCLSDMWWHYFTLRSLAVRGEKAQVRYLAEHDPEYLAQFRTCLAQSDRTLRFRAYEALAGLTVAPAGGLWPARATAIQPHTGPGWASDRIEKAQAFWAELCSCEE